MKFAKLFSLLLLGLLIISPTAASNDSIPDDKIVTIDTTVFKRFVVEQLGDVSCTFTVEIDPARAGDPIVRQETSCNNLLQFQANVGLEVSISKQFVTDGTPTPGEVAILDALGVQIDRSAPESESSPFATNCSFFDTDNNALGSGVSIDDVLSSELDNVWYDPTVDGDNTANGAIDFAQQSVLLNHPGGDVAAYDCRFKLDFFLSTDDFRLLPGGVFSYRMVFTSLAQS